MHLIWNPWHKTAEPAPAPRVAEQGSKAALGDVQPPPKRGKEEAYTSEQKSQGRPPAVPGPQHDFEASSPAPAKNARVSLEAGTHDDEDDDGDDDGR